MIMERQDIFRTIDDKIDTLRIVMMKEKDLDQCMVQEEYLTHLIDCRDTILNIWEEIESKEPECKMAVLDNNF